MKNSSLSRRPRPQTIAFSLNCLALFPAAATLAAIGGCASAPSPAPAVAAAGPALPAQSAAPAADTAKEAGTANSAAQTQAHAQPAAQPQNQSSNQNQGAANSASAAAAKLSAANQPAAETAQSRNELAMLKVEVMSLKEKVATLQRKFEVILKGQRSGIYDDVQLPPNIQSHFAPPKNNPVPPLVSEGPIEPDNGESNPAKRQNVLAVENPRQIVDKALVLLEQREFGRVAQALENFQQRFPNNALSAVAELTLAEAYVELKTPQQALTHVRTFYLQHPNDPMLNRAKWLEGMSQEQLGAPQRAAQLYREVIALNPQAQLALRARAALEKLSAGGAQ